MKTYTTSELAEVADIHPNTVRMYEDIGFISPVPRASNGYRVFSERHRYQLLVCRSIFGCDWPGKKLRTASLRIIKAMVEWNLKKAREWTEDYLNLLDAELVAAKETTEILRRWAISETPRLTGNTYTRPEAAELIGTTEEALRNWERNGLITVPRVGPNKTRVYSDGEIERLRIIYMLRQAKFGISAIYRSLREYDSGNYDEVLNALNSPEELEELSWVCVSDRWILALEKATAKTREILLLLSEIESEDF